MESRRSPYGTDLWKAIGRPMESYSPRYGKYSPSLWKVIRRPMESHRPFWAGNLGKSDPNLVKNFLYNFDTENGQNAPKAGRSPFGQEILEIRVEIWLRTFCITLIRKTARTRPKLDGGPFGQEILKIGSKYG